MNFHNSIWEYHNIIVWFIILRIVWKRFYAPKVDQVMFGGKVEKRGRKIVSKYYGML